MEDKRKLLLRILNIYCYMTDEMGFDDLYLVLKGKKIWPTNKRHYSIRPGQTKVDVEIKGFDEKTCLYGSSGLYRGRSGIHSSGKSVCVQQ